jgi:hypothetical protein
MRGTVNEAMYVNKFSEVQHFNIARMVVSVDESICDFGKFAACVDAVLMLSGVM